MDWHVLLQTLISKLFFVSFFYFTSLNDIALLTFFYQFLFSYLITALRLQLFRANNDDSELKIG